MEEFAPRASPSGRGRFLALLGLGLALRLANGALGSLKLDDFHSLYHARAADLATFFAVLREDNHPPLQFLLVRAARALLGEDPWALRLPALCAGLGTLALTWRIGARLPCAGARVAAVALVAVSSLHVELSSDLRMYALLTLACAGLLEGLLARLEDGRAAWRITLWTVVGLHAHYHFLYALACLGAALLALGLASRRYRAALRPCLAALALGAFLAAPWYLLGFPDQLAHGLAPGGSSATPIRLVEGFKSLVFLNVSVADGRLRLLGLAASGAMLALAAAGTWSLLRRAARERSLALSVLLLAAGFLMPVLSWTAANLASRAGFEWRYLASALPAFALLFGAEACAAGVVARVRRGAVWAVCAVALAVSLANARDPGEEDYRDAAAWIVARATPADCVVAADWQPELFPHGLGWDYYSARSYSGRAAARPERLAVGPGFALAAPAALVGRQRVFCCLRSVPRECALLRALRREFSREETLVFGRSVHVHVFTRAP